MGRVSSVLDLGLLASIYEDVQATSDKSQRPAQGRGKKATRSYSNGLFRIQER